MFFRGIGNRKLLAHLSRIFQQANGVSTTIKHNNIGKVKSRFSELVFIHLPGKSFLVFSVEELNGFFDRDVLG